MPDTKTGILQRAAISLSIANLCFLFVWGHILALATEGKFSYFLQRAPEQSLIWALTIDIAVLGAAVYGLLSLSRNSARLLVFSSRVAVGFLCLLALWQCQMTISAKLSSTVGSRFLMNLWTLEAAGILLLCIFRLRPALRALRALFLIFSPLFFVLLAQGLWFYCGPNSRRFDAGHAAGPLTSDAPHNRVIWIIFDELDGKLLFDARPSEFACPILMSCADRCFMPIT